METPVFLIVEATPNPAESEAFDTYISNAPKITQSYGGVPVANYNVEAALDGEDKPAVFAVLSFPSREAIESLFSDAEYQALVPVRDRAFSHLRYYLANEKV